MLSIRPKTSSALLGLPAYKTASYELSLFKVRNKNVHAGSDTIIPVVVRRKLNRFHTYIRCLDGFFTHASSSVRLVTSSAIGRPIQHGTRPEEDEDGAVVPVRYLDGDGTTRDRPAECVDILSSCSCRLAFTKARARHLIGCLLVN